MEQLLEEEDMKVLHSASFASKIDFGTSSALWLFIGILLMIQNKFDLHIGVLNPQSIIVIAVIVLLVPSYYKKSSSIREDIKNGNKLIFEGMCEVTSYDDYSLVLQVNEKKSIYLLMGWVGLKVYFCLIVTIKFMLLQ